MLSNSASGSTVAFLIRSLCGAVQKQIWQCVSLSELTTGCDRLTCLRCLTQTRTHIIMWDPPTNTNDIYVANLRLYGKADRCLTINLQLMTRSVIKFHKLITVAATIDSFQNFNQFWTRIENGIHHLQGVEAWSTTIRWVKVHIRVASIN